MDDPSKKGRVSEARRGLKEIMLSKFSSTPLQEAEYTPYDEMQLRKQLAEDRDDLQHDAALTPAEREYLSALLRSGDVHSMESASAVLRDDRLFPKNPEYLEAASSSDTASAGGNHHHDNEEASSKSSGSSVVGEGNNTTTTMEPCHRLDDHADAVTPKRGTSTHVVQRELFRLHESERNLKPSAVLKRMNFVHKNSILSQESSDYHLRNSSFLSTAEDELRQQPSHMDLTEPETITDDEEQATITTVNDTMAASWNPFEDVSSWLYGSQGVEVSDDGTPQIRRDVNLNNNSNNINDQNFRILGTTADDVSCHPHVLSPPLMESLLAFVPEYDSLLSTASETSITCLTKQQQQHQWNMWLKYSLVRDGATMWAFLRKVRASTLCFLAIETEDGNVFGSFTSQPWRLSKGWYGREDAFLWRLRRSRLKSAGEPIVEQILHESEIQVFPYRTGNAAIQYCSKKCLMMGQGEVFHSPTFHDPTKPKTVRVGKHYGHGLSLDKNLKHGTTSSSETFGNPCLVDPSLRGARFNVANIEVWTVTPHATVEDAERTELSDLFLDGGRDEQRLNFMNILVGGPI